MIKYISILILVLGTMLVINSCEIIEPAISSWCAEHQEIDFCNDVDDEPPLTPLASQALICGGAEELTATYIDSQLPSYTGTNGEIVNWWKFSKNTPVPGSGSINFYDTTSVDLIDKIIYTTPNFDGKITGYESIITDIIEVGIDSFHYVHPQIPIKVGGIVGPNAPSNGASSTISIECEGWADIGDNIYVTYDETD